MIEGLKIDIPAEELKNHLLARVLHHRTKADFYKDQWEKLRQMNEQDIDVQRSMANNSSNAVSEANSAAHRRKAMFFSFLADHIITGEMYRLSDKDLTDLEMYAKYI